MAPPLLALAALAALCSSAQIPQHELFDGRRLEKARFEGPPGTRTPRGFELQGPGTSLASELALGPGDTGVIVRMVQIERGGLGAALRIEDSVIGLDGEKGALFVDGPLFEDRYARLGDGNAWITTGKAFELTVRRVGTALQIAIDGKPVHQATVGTQVLGRVAIFPGRARVVVERFVMDGSVVQPTAVARDDKLQAQVEAVTRRAVDWLLAAQLRDGSWRHVQHGFRGGQTALCAYTLLRCGLPVDHPSVQRAFLFLDHVEPGETYSAGLMAMAYEATGDPARRPRIEALARTIVSWDRGGQWGYPNVHENDFAIWTTAPSNPDLSNTQYAALGLRASRHAGVDVPDKLWAELIDRTLTLQETSAATAESRKSGRAPPAGFRYAVGHGINLSMTAAGISVLEIARQALGPKLRGDRLVSTERAIEAGVAWMDERYTPEGHAGGGNTWHYYALYGVERVGTMLDVETIGGREWYPEGARWLLKNQSDDGSFSLVKPFGEGSGHAAQEEADTCFALLFLRRASRPTVRTASESWGVREEVDPTETIRFRARGDTVVILWIDGFSDAFLAESGGAAGLRLARVEYKDGDRVLASVPADPTVAWDGQSFAVRHTFDAAGAHALKARLTFVEPLTPLGEIVPLKSAESQAVTVRSAGVMEPWMREAAQARERNLLLAILPKAASSSAHGGETADKAIDGREDSRWVCAPDDASPWVVLELAKPVKADTLVLGQGGCARDIAGRYDRITEVLVRVNREKEPIVWTLPASEIAPAVLQLGKIAPVSRLEVRISKRVPGTVWKGHVALSEIALEKRGG